MNEPQRAINDYRVNWSDMGARPDLASSISSFLDTAFNWVNDSTDSRYVTIEQQRARMLEVSPELNIRNRNDGFDLEAERLLAIQQKNSRGFNIVDINPGLLDANEYAMSLPYEFIFDGTNFIPANDGGLTKNFRTITIPIAGNFLKVEYIYENNTRANVNTPQTRPYAKRKYESIAPDERNLVVGQTAYSFDNYARTKVYVNFNSVSEKPHIVTRSGDSFKSYFNEVTITLNIGAPKIRLTIGFNSEKQDGPSVAAFNSTLSMHGTGRLFADSDSVLIPFCITEIDNFVGSYTPEGEGINVTIAQSTFSKNIIQNLNAVITSKTDFFGYSVLWITRLRFTLSKSLGAATTVNARVSLLVANPSGTELKRVHSFTMNLYVAPGMTEYVYEPADALCVVIPSYCALTLAIVTMASANVTINYSHSIDGYSYGEILALPVPGNPAQQYLTTSKYITDATLIPNFNRISQISRY